MGEGGGQGVGVVVVLVVVGGGVVMVGDAITLQPNSYF
jgi:hypothetical protein